MRIQVMSASQQREEVEKVNQILIQAGLMSPSQIKKGPLPPDPVSKEERAEIAKILGQAPGKPLSEIVIEERGLR